MASASTRECQTSNGERSARSVIVDRYSDDTRHTASVPSASARPTVRAATTMLAASRFRSHSQGPTWVSSKSLTSKTRLRSGVAYVPKLSRWASPQIWIWTPVEGVRLMSLAITAGAPRKKVNGDSDIRSLRTGTRSASRVRLDAASSATGSVRSLDARHSPWTERRTPAAEVAARGPQLLASATRRRRTHLPDDPAPMTGTAGPTTNWNENAFPPRNRTPKRRGGSRVLDQQVPRSAPGRTRTCDRPLRRRLLCPLSYGGLGNQTG